MKIKIERYLSDKRIRARVYDGWVETYRNGVRVTCVFGGNEYTLDDELFYNKYGHPTGWHPIVYDEFFTPYMGRILNEVFKMQAGDVRFITVEER
ncbi:MAG: hypothetical protein PHU71_06540 [Candidatus Gracilibacteria bacterium]|nr:hypothetical protein [Candidatus Gracilibacteria bacterium]